jgi:hypothetical protein
VEEAEDKSGWFFIKKHSQKKEDIQMVKKMLLVSVLGAVLIGSAALLTFADSSWLKGTTEKKLDTLASIQPGLGTVMIEYSNRMGNAYYAAKAKNWGMAAYQLKEAVEIQEVGETTRPARASLLKAFEKKNLKPLARDIVNQDFGAFQNNFKTMVDSCNACHKSSGYGYIAYELPSQPLTPAKLDINQTFSKEQLGKILGDLVSKK